MRLEIMKNTESTKSKITKGHNVRHIKELNIEG